MQMIYISLHQGKWELGKKLESPFSSPYRWLGPALLLPPPANPNFYSSPCIKLLFKATLGLFPPKTSRIQRMGCSELQDAPELTVRTRRTWGFILSLTISVFFTISHPPKKKKITSAWDTIQPDTETPSPPSVSPFSGSHLEHRVFPPSPGAPGGGPGWWVLPPPHPSFIFNFTRGSGDLRGFGVSPAVFCRFQPFCFLFRAGIPLVAPWGCLGGSMDPFWWGLGGSVQLLLLLGSSPAPHKEKFQGGIFMPRVGLDFLSDFFFFALYSHYFGLFWGFFYYFPSPPFPAPPPLFLFLRAGDFPLYFSFLHIDLKIIKEEPKSVFWGGFGKEIKLKERPQLQPPPFPPSVAYLNSGKKGKWEKKKTTKDKKKEKKE